MNIEISNETLNKAFEESINKMLAPDNYNNPVKRIVETVIGSSYKGDRTELGEAIVKKIEAKVHTLIESDAFDAMLGQAVAEAIAKREVQKK